MDVYYYYTGDEQVAGRSILDDICIRKKNSRNSVTVKDENVKLLYFVIMLTTYHL